MPDKINLAQKFSQIKEYWKPYIAGELNGQLVKLDKLKGESSGITMRMKMRCF